MYCNREIDRVFKKVREGLEEFDFTYEKLQDCDNQSQKEKLEADLKKEIKKLQRSREQIKNWMSGSEVKDKAPLIEHRKMIEHEMERFKEVEKMMKTKAFSNEALASTSEIVDPRKKEKMETADFIQGNIEELQRQMEAMEAELDQILSTMKKKKPDLSKQAQIEALQESLGRHKWHISKLESILRHLENDNLDVEQINDIREDIEYYVESNEDPNFVEDDTFYEALGLDDMEDSFAVIGGDESEAPDTPGRANSVIDDKDKDKEKERESIRDKESEKDFDKDKEKEKEKDKSRKNKDKEDSEKDKEKSDVSRIPEPHAAILHSQLSQGNVNSPAGKSATLASTLSASLNATNSVNSSTTGGLKPATPIGTPKLKYATAALSGIKKAPAKTPTTVSYASLASSVSNGNAAKPSPTVAASTQTVQTSSPSQNADSSNASGSGKMNIEAQTSSLNSSITNDIENLASLNASRILNNTTANSPEVNNIQESLSFLNPENYSNLPAGYDQYLRSLESAKDRIFEFKKREELHVPSKKSQPRAIVCDVKLPPLEEISAHLESSLLNCPDSYDADKPRSYIPTNPYVTQPSFPTDPLPEIIGSTKLLEKVAEDTLFHGFYYNNLRTPSKFTNFHNLEPNPDDDYLQYIMSKELHNRGWNYQKHNHTWFKDADSTNGCSIFDFNDGWGVKKTPDFKFDVNDVETGYLY